MKKFDRKRPAALLMLLSAVLLGACSKFLDIAPLAAVPDQSAITDKASLNTAIRGAYRSLGAAGYYGGDYTLQGFVPSGNVVYQVFNNLQNLNFLPEDASFKASWDAAYATINIANNIITRAPAIADPDLTEEERKVILGEAHFIRALAYFDLARAFGGVPLKLSPTTDLREEAALQRSSLKDTYAQVLGDLQLAEDLLPASTNRIRAGRQAVWALRARYHLYNREWADAGRYATRVIELHEDYQLVSPFNAWFANGATQTRESILELAFSAQHPNGLRTVMSLQARGGEYRFRPSENVISLLRNPNAGGGRLALLDSASQSGTRLYAGALYYRSPATDPVYLLRIAEQYLIRAEARAWQNDLPGALQDLNAVRGRAGLAPLKAGTREEILDAILEERRFEFLWEAHRYFDLARTGKLEAEIKRLAPNIKILPKHYLFPVPANDVIIGGLAQNPGY